MKSLLAAALAAALSLGGATAEAKPPEVLTVVQTEALVCLKSDDAATVAVLLAISQERAVNVFTYLAMQRRCFLFAGLVVVLERQEIENNVWVLQATTLDGITLFLPFYDESSEDDGIRL